MSTYIKCSRCKEHKSTTEFRRNRTTSRGYSYWCNCCQSARQKELGHPHERKYRERQSTINRDEYLAYFKQNHEHNKIARLEMARRWKDHNRDQNLAIVGARRMRRKEATPSWVNMKELRVIYREAVRLSKTLGTPYVVDHYYPLYGENVCGLHVTENLQIITKEENLVKSNLHPDVFYNNQQMQQCF